MLSIGCDYHPGMQQIAWFDEHSGEGGEQRLEHSRGEAERFYRELKRRGAQVRVGIEASGQTRWFERLLAELEMELWIGNPAKPRIRRPRPGPVRETTGCVVEHRPVDSGAPLPSAEGSLQS